MMKILITGSTGFIGSELLRYLLIDPNIDTIYLPIRSKYNLSAQQRFNQLIEYWTKFFPPSTINEIKKNLNKINVIECSLDNISPLYEQVKSCDYIFHTAAITNLDVPLSLAKKENLHNTQKLLLWASTLPNLKKFIYFSTAFVCGTLKGLMKENNEPSSFNNYYEQTKKEAEIAIPYFKIPYLILRPTIVVGDTLTGYTRHFKVIYYVFKIWQTGILKLAPINPHTTIDIVPIDYVIRVALYLALSSNITNTCVHICSGMQSPKAIDIFISASKIFNINNTKILPSFIRKILLCPLAYPFLSSDIKNLILLMKAYFPYLYEDKRCFDNSYLTTLIPSSEKNLSLPLYEEYANKIWLFCKNTNWGKKALDL